MPPKKIIIDTDPGQDDAIAILLALASPDEIEVLGITTVAGNVPLELTTKNACIVFVQNWHLAFFSLSFVQKKRGDLLHARRVFPRGI